MISLNFGLQQDNYLQITCKFLVLTLNKYKSNSYDTSKSYLCTRRVKKNGDNPIVIRISLQGKTRDIPTGYSCRIDLWDKKNNTLKTKTKDLEIIAQRIKDFEYLLIDKIRELEF